MKRFLFVLCLVGLAVACGPREPVVEAPDGIEDNLCRFGVNTNPYEYFNVAETPVPDGYKPFYISHYGRHGAMGMARWWRHTLRHRKPGY